MNKDTAQLIIDNLVSDISDVIQSGPSKNTCIWWRGRLSGVSDTLKSVTEQVDLERIEKALDALIEAEVSFW